MPDSIASRRSQQTVSSVFLAYGASFSVDGFLSQNSFPVIEVWRNDQPHSKSGFTALVSQAEGVFLQRQFDDAITFLRSHHASLKHLAEDSSVEGRYLYFHAPLSELTRPRPAQLVALAESLKIRVEVEDPDEYSA